MSDCVNVDYVKGRAKGCQTYCCRLLVRLEPDERKPGISKSFMAKGADGYCANLNREPTSAAPGRNGPAFAGAMTATATSCCKWRCGTHSETSRS